MRGGGGLANFQAAKVVEILNRRAIFLPDQTRKKLIKMNKGILKFE